MLYAIIERCWDLGTPMESELGKKVRRPERELVSTNGRGARLAAPRSLLIHYALEV